MRRPGRPSPAASFRATRLRSRFSFAATRVARAWNFLFVSSAPDSTVPESRVCGKGWFLPLPCWTAESRRQARRHAEGQLNRGLLMSDQQPAGLRSCPLELRMDCGVVRHAHLVRSTKTVSLFDRRAHRGLRSSAASTYAERWRAAPSHCLLKRWPPTAQDKTRLESVAPAHVSEVLIVAKPFSQNFRARRASKMGGFVACPDSRAQ